MDNQWENLIWPMLKDKGIDFHCVVDLAAGHGRNSANYATMPTESSLSTSPGNIDACQERFKGDDRFAYIKNDGISLATIADESITFIYTFDSMVHFDSDVV